MFTSYLETKESWKKPQLKKLDVTKVGLTFTLYGCLPACLSACLLLTHAVIPGVLIGSYYCKERGKQGRMVYYGVPWLLSEHITACQFKIYILFLLHRCRR